MRTPFTSIIRLFCLLLLACAPSARASHIIGGEMTYTYLGDTTIGSSIVHKYRLTFSLYEDCMRGQPESINQDNPAFIALYKGLTPYTLIQADSILYSTAVVVPANALGPCGYSSSSSCVLKKTFVRNYYLPPTTSGYTFSYQRCCRNGSIANIVQPTNIGVTYTCSIPPSAVVATNSSATFTAYPPAVIALSNPASIDLSATDADGDSLSYELCSALKGASDADIKPWPPGPPPFDSVTYPAPLSATNPVHASQAFNIDPVTGRLTGIPDLIGVYLVTVCCHEWRDGVLINTTRREFQLHVETIAASDYKPDAGPDVSILAGDSVQFNARGANIYQWEPATGLSDPNIPNPVGYFPEPGVFIYKLHGITDSGCTGDDYITVQVVTFSYYVVPSAFTPNGDGNNDFLAVFRVGNASFHRFKVFNRWGNMVYSGGPHDPFWNGTYHDRQQDMGTYYWELEYTDNVGKTRIASGSTILVR